MIGLTNLGKIGHSLNSVSIIDSATKTSYSVGDSLNTAGLRIDATLDNSSTFTCTPQVTYSVPSGDITNLQTTDNYVTCSFKNKTTGYSISVISSYSITCTLTNCTGDSSNPTTIAQGGTATLTFTANSGYALPDTITVSGATYTWDKSTGTLVLSNPVSNVTIAITAEIAIYSITCTLTNCTGDSSNPTTIAQGGTATLTFTANSGYTLPDTITVSGATYTWDKSTGTVVLSNPTGNVGISITGEEDIGNHLIMTITMTSAGSMLSMSKKSYPSATPEFHVILNGTELSGTYTPSTLSLSGIAGENVVEIWGDNPDGLSTSGSAYYKFVVDSSSTVVLSGNIMGLIDGTSTSPTTTIPNDYCFARLFSGVKITDASQLVLPSTTLTTGCYFRMFDSCTTLTTPPIIKALTLAENCCQYMFNSCSSLTSVPKLPATTLASGCYQRMFSSCGSLYVSDSPISGTAEQAWTIPTSDTFTNTYSQSSMFANCLGTRSSDDMAGAAGNSYTYYTQNTPV